MEHPIVQLDADWQAFPGHTIPAERHGAGQRVMLEIDEVVREPDTGAP